MKAPPSKTTPSTAAPAAFSFSANRAASWTTLHDFAHPVIWLEPHPTNANIMYASVVHTNAGGIYVTSNLLSGVSSTWTRLAAPPRTEGHPLSIHVLRDNTLVCSYSGRLNAAGTFTHSSGVFVSTDGGASWADRSVPNMQCWTRDLVIYPFRRQPEHMVRRCFRGMGAGPAVPGRWALPDHRPRPDLERVHVRSLSLSLSCRLNRFPPIQHQLRLYQHRGERTALLHQHPGRRAHLSPRHELSFFGPRRLFTNPYDAGEIWATSAGNGLRVGWLTEPRPVFDQLTADAGTVGYGGWGCDSQHLRIQTSSNLAAWSDSATKLITGGRFAGGDATAGAAGQRFYRAVVASPITGSSP